MVATAALLPGACAAVLLPLNVVALYYNTINVVPVGTIVVVVRSFLLRFYLLVTALVALIILRGLLFTSGRV
jgi:hypothetical protein